MNPNHSNPFPNPSFTFIPQNPNPNFPHYFPPPPQPPPPSLPPPPIPSFTTNSLPHSNPNLLTSLSDLKHLIETAENTLTSITNLLNLTNTHDFISCPFDPHHRMPPESLFRHSLQCPSSPSIINLDILDSLHYPHSLKSQEQLLKENPFLQSLPDSQTELCFSIDDYGDFGSNYFYKDCPGVYCSAELDSSKRFFTLPAILSLHCANFSNGSRNNQISSIQCLGILPSDILSVRRELDAWNDYPYSYSLLVLRVVLGFGMIKESSLLKWIISNSNRFGVIIDAPMRDHIFLLLKLCMKAISLEARRSNELVMNDDVKRNGGLDLRSFSFNCPVLVEAMTWLASQLSILYGEPNGKFFSIDLLKQWILNAASSLLVFPLEKKHTETSGLKEGIGKLDGTIADMNREFPKDKVIGNVKIEELTEECEKGNSSNVANTSVGLVFVSQVAAAIAALRERSLLELQIKGLRMSLSKSQRLTEYSNVIMRADEEKRKRSDYRPILDYDGLLWHRSHNQDSNKNKSREELLAEERDYKRRRMSYRGKKAKRSVTEVMRDIIEEHMEEIKQAGGIGCFVKGSAEGAVFPPGPVSVNDTKVDHEFKKNECVSAEPSRGKSHDYMKQMQQPERRASLGHHERLDDQQKSSRYEKRDREYRSRSPQEYRSHGRSHDKHRHRRDHDEMEKARSKYDKYDSASPKRAQYRDSRSSSYVSNTSNDISDKKYDRVSKSKDYHKGRTYGNRRSESVTQTVFEDRYDPSESDSKPADAYDAESSRMKYDRKKRAT